MGDQSDAEVGKKFSTMWMDYKMAVAGEYFSDQNLARTGEDAFALSHSPHPASHRRSLPPSHIPLVPLQLLSPRGTDLTASKHLATIHCRTS